MSAPISQFFMHYAGPIVFLHVLSAVIWVGGMIAIRFTVHPSLQSIDEPAIKLGKTLEIVGKLFNLVLPFIIILLITAILMILGLQLKASNHYWIVILKEAIWTIMTINFAWMYWRRRRAWRHYQNGDLTAAKALVAAFPNRLLPLNMLLGVIALYAGVALRGFT